MMGEERGAAVYFIYAIVVLLVCGIVWYIGNQLLWSEHGIGTVYEEQVPENSQQTNDVIKWVWNVWPIVVIIGAAIYTILAAQIQEPVTYY